MKMILLAAAAALAMPALAQTTPATSSPGTGMPDTATPADSTAPQSTQDTNMSPAQTDPMPATPADTANPAGTTTQTNSMPMANSAGDPVGGYQPSAPAMSGTMTPGVQPVFRAAPSPSEAYPAPAPMASYPICKKGQFDKCMNGPRSTHSREVRGRPSR